MNDSIFINRWYSQSRQLLTRAERSYKSKDISSQDETCKNFHTNGNNNYMYMYMVLFPEAVLHSGDHW